MPDLVQPVSEILQEFALSFLSLRLQPEVLRDTGNLPRFRLPEAGPIYGALFTAFEVPPGLGRTAAVEPDYFETLLKLTFVSTTREQAFLAANVVYVNRGVQLVRFFNGPYAQCIYEVLPGVAWNFSYLVVGQV